MRCQSVYRRSLIFVSSLKSLHFVNSTQNSTLICQKQIKNKQIEILKTFIFDGWESGIMENAKQDESF